MLDQGLERAGLLVIIANAANWLYGKRYARRKLIDPEVVDHAPIGKDHERSTLFIVMGVRISEVQKESVVSRSVPNEHNCVRSMMLDLFSKPPRITSRQVNWLCQSANRASSQRMEVAKNILGQRADVVLVVRISITEDDHALGASVSCQVPVDGLRLKRVACGNPETIAETRPGIVSAWISGTGTRCNGHEQGDAHFGVELGCSDGRRRRAMTQYSDDIGNRLHMRSDRTGFLGDAIIVEVDDLDVEMLGQVGPRRREFLGVTDCTADRSTL
ncbi:MAG: hypothetical protein AAF628_19470 [Planctomycetota bacterium]